MRRGRLRGMSRRRSRNKRGSVGWAKRSVPTITGTARGRWARFALPTLRSRLRSRASVRIPAASFHPSFEHQVPRKAEGAGNARCLTTPIASHAEWESIRVRHHRFARQSGIPCAIGFNGLSRALPGDRLSCHHSRRDAKHHRQLTPASRRRDHTTSPSACRAFVICATGVHRIPTQRS